MPKSSAKEHGRRDAVPLPTTSAAASTSPPQHAQRMRMHALSARGASKEARDRGPTQRRRAAWPLKVSPSLDGSALAKRAWRVAGSGIRALNNHLM